MSQLTLKKSSVANKVPATTDLVYGELALNYADGKLYYKTATNTISSIGGSTFDPASPGPIGETTASTGKFTTLSLTDTPLALSSGGTGKSSAPAAQANLLGYTATATAAGTTTLTNTSSFYQLFTGETTQTVVLPVTSTLALGWPFRINNSSTGSLTVNSSDGSLVVTVVANATVMCTCIDTTVTTAAGWRVGITEVANATGSGNMVLSSSPAITNPSVTGALTFTGTSTNNTVLHTSQSTGTITIGGTAGTGLITFGRSTATQTTSIQDGVTTTGNIKTVTIGTNGASGSTTNITLGSATSGATSTTTINGTLSVTKLIKPKVNQIVSSSATALTWDSSIYDQYALTGITATALTVNLDSNSSPLEGQKMLFRFTTTGVSCSISFTATGTNLFRTIGTTTPVVVASGKTAYVGCVYNSTFTPASWDIVAVSIQA
jgi:hypothetical protein